MYIYVYIYIYIYIYTHTHPICAHPLCFPGVDTGPAQLSPAAAVLPLESWYSYEFDHFDPKPGSVKFDKHCAWPMGYDHVWQFMLALNEPKLAIPLSGDVITCSHFLPRQVPL